jgi:hypothetical protein
MFLLHVFKWTTNVDKIFFSEQLGQFGAEVCHQRMVSSFPHDGKTDDKHKDFVSWGKALNCHSEIPGFYPHSDLCVDLYSHRLYQRENFGQMKLGPCSDLEPTLNSWSPLLTIICMITLPLEELNLLYGLTF